MPVEVTRLEDGGLLIRGRGVVTGAELIEANTEIYSSPETTASVRYQLVDLSDVERGVADPAEIQQLAEQDQSAAALNPTMVIAIVGSGDVPYGLARMWEAYVAERFPTRVFRRREEAEAWLAAKVGTEPR
jgi:hypothetical protein